MLSQGQTVFTAAWTKKKKNLRKKGTEEVKSKEEEVDFRLNLKVDSEKPRQEREGAGKREEEDKRDPRKERGSR